MVKCKKNDSKKLELILGSVFLKNGIGLPHLACVSDDFPLFIENLIVKNKFFLQNIFFRWIFWIKRRVARD